MKKSNTGTYHPTGARRYSHSNFKNGGTIRACCFRAVGERWGQQYGTRVATAWMIWWCRAARDDLITCFCSIAPVGVQLQKPRPTRTWGMYYAERDSAFAQRLGTVGAAIQRALPQSSTAVYAKKGCHCIEKSNGSTLCWTAAKYGLSGLRTTGFWNIVSFRKHR